MAAAACASLEETESFITCSICLCEFDAEFRKPKFLPCAHTVCLKCLEEIHKDFVIACPLCRKEFSYQDNVSCLPNNSYVLHMLKLSGKNAESASKPEVQGKPTWCLTCGVVAKQSCSVHSIIDASATTIKNFESLLNLRDDLKKMRDQGQTKLALAIEKRREIQTHFQQLSQSLKLVLHEVTVQEEQNDLCLVEMISELEANSPQLKSRPLSSEMISGEDDQDPILSEIMSVVNGSKPEDSFEILREKMKKTLHLYESKLAESVALSKSITYQRKSNISVWLTDSKDQVIPTWDLLETGFNTYWPNDTSLSPTKRDFLLLSHIVFSIQKRGQKMNKQTNLDCPSVTYKAKPVATKSGEPSSSVKSEENTTVKLDPSTEKFDLTKSTFILTVHRHGTLKGTVHIKLFASCDSPFVQQLGKICFHSPKHFSDAIEKTVPDVFLLLSACKDMSDFSYNGLTDLPPARHYMEAGISLHSDEKGVSKCWSLVFPLSRFEEKKNEMHLKTLQSVHFIGQVKQGIDVIEMLSWTSKHQRSGYTFTLESR
ncbi:uncharacterized protein LOC130698043 [Daphnia carinata]|uniref:uncharacterized protein LOC130698043 n=1 Tax=Daphnia carinata TaxID=120202 RepID=UPI00257ADD86|nr:uncharacterized protein LOC130698043 [Daphnia carinata]XP_057376809.1 uncharacterized protein LOC130698043 [Daphnia carinata]